MIGILFEVICLRIHNAYVFPHFTTILKDTFLLFGDKNTYIYSGYTVLHLLESLGFAGFFGIAFGVLAGMRKEAYAILKPLMTMLRSLPIIILILILMITLGFTKSPVVATSLVLFPLIYEGVYQGVAHLDKDLLDVYKMHSSFNLKVLFRVYLPLISSYSKTVFINAIGMGIKILITTEYLCGLKKTLGAAIQNSWNLSEYSLMYSYSVIAIVLTLLLEAIPYFICFIYHKMKEVKK